MKLRDIEIGIEEFILACIVLLNILQVLNLLGPDLDYLKKLISWSALGYLLYVSQPTKILTGIHNKTTDTLLLLGCFGFFLKDIVSIAFSLEQGGFVGPLYAAIVRHATIIELTGIYFGIVIFVYLAFRFGVHVRSPSIVSLLHMKTYSGRMIASLCALFGYFIIIFSLMMEWLAIAIDAPLLIIGLAVYLFFILKHKEHFETNSFLKKFGDFGGDFYEQLLENLKYKHRFLLVITGFLLLHLVTDAFVFIWSYLSGVSDPLYFAVLERVQFSFASGLQSAFAQFGVLGILLTLVSLVGILALLLTPVLLWWDMYTKKKTIIHPWVATLLGVSMLSLVFTRQFRFSSIVSDRLYGVDIISQPLRLYMHPLVIISILALCGVGLWLLTRSHHHLSVRGIIFVSVVFVTYYIAMYYASAVTYFTDIIPALAQAQIWAVMSLLSIFFLITTAFYIVGVIYFIVDATRHAKEHIKVA